MVVINSILGEVQVWTVINKIKIRLDVNGKWSIFLCCPTESHCLICSHKILYKSWKDTRHGHVPVACLNESVFLLIRTLCRTISLFVFFSESFWKLYSVFKTLLLMRKSILCHKIIHPLLHPLRNSRTILQWNKRNLIINSVFRLEFSNLNSSNIYIFIDWW